MERGCLAHSEENPNKPNIPFTSERFYGCGRESGGEVFHAGCEQRLILFARNVLERAVAVAFRMAHLAEHATVRAGDAFNGQ